MKSPRAGQSLTARDLATEVTEGTESGVERFQEPAWA